MINNLHIERQQQIKKQIIQSIKVRKNIMSVYQHRRNFSLITTQPHPSTKIKTTNRSLRKIQNQLNQIQPNLKNQMQNYQWLLVAARQYYHKTNNLHAAISNFQEYLSHFPNHQQSLYLCAVCYMHLEQYGRAIQKLKDYLSTKKISQNSLGLTLNRKLIINSSMQLPNIGHAYLLLSMAYNKINNIPKAIEAVNEALRNDNKFQQGYCFRAKLYLKLNQNQKAFYDYKQVLRINNKCWAAWVGLGDYYTQIMNYQQGLKSYQKAKQYIQMQKISQKPSVHYYNLSDMQQQQKQQQKIKKQEQHEFIREGGTNFKKDSRNKNRYEDKKISKINQKIRQFVQKPTQQFQFNKQRQSNYQISSQSREKQKSRQKIKSQLMVNSINKPKFKVALKSINSPYSFTHNQQTMKSPDHKLDQQISPKIMLSRPQNISQRNTQPLQQQPQTQILQQLQLKVGICLYYLGNYSRSIHILQALLATNKASNYNSQIYYYLAINQLRIFDEHKKDNNKRNIKISISAPQEMDNKQIINPINKSKTANVGVITTSSTSSHNPKNTLTNQLINSIKSPEINQIQLTPFQLLHQSILNLQSSITSNNNKKIMAKSCKMLIRIYIENNQFYQTQFVLKLANKYELDKDQTNLYGINQYKTLCQVCMLVIRQKYEQATPTLKKLYDNITANNDNMQTSKTNKQNLIKNQYDNIRKYDDNEINISKRGKYQQKNRQKQKQKCLSLRLSKNKPKNQLKSENKICQYQFQGEFKKYEDYFISQNQDKVQRQKQMLVNSTGSYHQKYDKLHIDIKSMKRINQQISYTMDRDKEKKKNNDNFIIDTRIERIEDNSLDYNQFKNISIRNKISNSNSPKNQAPFSAHQSQNQKLFHQPSIYNSLATSQSNWMIPIILLFRAYAEYFSDNFIQCLEIYEHYQNFIKDYLGKQPDTDINLSYNKILCEGILMLDNQMIQESIDKFMLAVENYYRLMKSLAVQPILFRVMALIRLSISQSPILSEQINSRNKIFISILQTLDHYMPAIKGHSLVHYYYALVLYELERYKQASDSLERCLKVAEECTWKFLYVKGVVQIKNRLYKQAIRQFSAGLLVQQRAQIYLGRCICYIQLFDQSQGQTQAYMQKSFQDLQKFIQLQQDKDKISKWVTKILFFNKAFQQVTKSIKKVSTSTLQTEEDMIKIDKCMNIYNGLFQEGGVLGQMLINAFQGKFVQSSIEINGQRHEVILSDFIEKRYKKWLIILNLYSGQRYSQLIKLLQLNIFQQKSQQQAIQLRYNLAIVYYLLNQSSKADNILAGLPKNYPDITNRVDKFINRELLQDQCVDDLQKQIKGIRRLSSYLPYRRILLRGKGKQPQKSIFVKISLPFPNFFKPNIDINLDDSFMYGQTSQSCVPKKIQAPWIKKVTGHIQFTDNIVESQNTSIFQQDVLQPENQQKQSKYQQQSSDSSISIKKQ